MGINYTPARTDGTPYAVQLNAGGTNYKDAIASIEVQGSVYRSGDPTGTVTVKPYLKVDGSLSVTKTASLNGGATISEGATINGDVTVNSSNVIKDHIKFDKNQYNEYFHFIGAAGQGQSASKDEFGGIGSRIDIMAKQINLKQNTGVGISDVRVYGNQEIYNNLTVDGLAMIYRGATIGVGVTVNGDAKINGPLKISEGTLTFPNMLAKGGTDYTDTGFLLIPYAEGEDKVTSIRYISYKYPAGSIAFIGPGHDKRKIRVYGGSNSYHEYSYPRVYMLIFTGETYEYNGKTWAKPSYYVDLGDRSACNYK